MLKALKSWQFSLAIAILIAVAAIAGAIYGVTTHTEPGWMQDGPMWNGRGTRVVCVRSYASAIMDENMISIATPEDLASGEVTIHLINDRLGFDMYRLSPHLGERECDVVLTYGVPTEQGIQEPGGSAYLNRVSGVCVADVANATGELKTLVAYHELGHCLGLDHDDYEQSIMRRTQRETRNGDFPARFSDSDRDLVRQVYMEETN